MTTLTAASRPLLGKRTFADFVTDSVTDSASPTPPLSIAVPASVSRYLSKVDYPSNGTLHIPRTAPSSRPPSPSQVSHSVRGSPLHESHHFLQDASLVLIGLHGAGVSSLAVIASKALQWRIIDAQERFTKLSGYSRSEYKKRHGIAKYCQQEVDVMQKLFANYGSRTIIAYGGHIPTKENGSSHVLREYAKTHPVVHVSRDAASSAAYLDVELERITQLKRITTPLYRACSNLEFYNFTEKSCNASSTSDEPSHMSRVEPAVSLPPYLTLKAVEQDFLRLLEHISQGHQSLTNIVASFPLSSVPLESRQYTHALVLPLSVLEKEEFLFEDIDSGVDAIELVIDTGSVSETKASANSELRDRICRQYARLRRATVLPLVYHVATDGTLSYTSTSLESYLELVQLGVRLCAEYLVIDLSLSDEVLGRIMSSRGDCKVIGVQHAHLGWNGGWSGPQPTDSCQRASKIGCDAIRLSQSSSAMSDNFAVLAFVHRLSNGLQLDKKLPVCAYNTGISGRMSQCFNSFLTPVTHELLRHTSTYSDAGQLVTAKEANRALFSSFYYDRLQFYVVGKHVSHSLSPAMHNAAYEVMGMPHCYDICEISSLRELSDIIAKPDFGGCAVALPYKVEIIALVKTLDENAEAIGAVNTLVPIRDDPESKQSGRVYNRAGRVTGLHGVNTDWIGIKNTVSSGLSPVNAVSSRTVALVLGAGGMGRAAIHALIKLGVKKLFLHNRSLDNALRVARHFQARGMVSFHEDVSFITPPPDPNGKPILHILKSISEEWPSDLAGHPTIIVAAVAASAPDGLLLHHPDITIPDSWLLSSTGGVLLDLAYRPIVTALLRQVRSKKYEEKGWVTKDMLSMLPEQAYAQFEILTGCRAPRKVMRKALIQAYREKWEPEVVAQSAFANV